MDIFRKQNNYLRQKTVGYHTYSLSEERKLRVVICGIPKKLDIEEVNTNIHAQEYTVSKARSMFHTSDNAPMDLVVTELDLTPLKAIFNITPIANYLALVSNHPAEMTLSFSATTVNNIVTPLGTVLPTLVPQNSSAAL